MLNAVTAKNAFVWMPLGQDCILNTVTGKLLFFTFKRPFGKRVFVNAAAVKSDFWCRYGNILFFECFNAVTATFHSAHVFWYRAAKLHSSHWLCLRQTCICPNAVAAHLHFSYEFELPMRHNDMLHMFWVQLLQNCISILWWCCYSNIVLWWCCYSKIACHHCRRFWR